MSQPTLNSSALILYQTEEGRTHLQTANYDNAALQPPSPPSGERAGVRGRARDQQQATELPLIRPADTLGLSRIDGRRIG
jgi:hypothetical protein